MKQSTYSGSANIRYAGGPALTFAELHQTVEPGYLYNDRNGSVVREGDEICSGEWNQNHTNDFQICQSCQETFPNGRENSICPHCGYDIDKAIKEQLSETNIHHMFVKSIDSHYDTMNRLYHYMFTGDIKPVKEIIN